MKIKRYKKVHRALRFYSLHFGFRKPYQLLIDGTICLTALKNKINLHDQLPTYLDGDVKLLTTQCIVKETEALGPALFGACLIVKQYPVHQCGHDTPVTGSKCILSMLTNNNASRYIVASQDRELQEKCRKRVGVPLLYLHITTPTLEAPSPVSQEWAKERTRETCAIREVDQQVLSSLKGPEEEDKPRRAKKRPRAPNPLSCKKKKGKPGQGGLGLPKKDKKHKKRKKTVLEKKVRKEVLVQASE